MEITLFHQGWLNHQPVLDLMGIYDDTKQLMESMKIFHGDIMEDNSMLWIYNGDII